MVAQQSHNTGKKKAVTVLGVVVGVIVVLAGSVFAYDWFRFQPYRTLAQELNQVLGGGYRVSYKWNCGLETPNCPSVRMIKDASFSSNDEARAEIESFRQKLTLFNAESIRLGLCDEDELIGVYCTLTAKYAQKNITINTKKDFIGVDITP